MFLETACHHRRDVSCVNLSSGVFVFYPANGNRSEGTCLAFGSDSTGIDVVAGLRTEPQAPTAGLRIGEETFGQFSWLVPETGHNAYEI